MQRNVNDNEKTMDIGDNLNAKKTSINVYQSIKKNPSAVDKFVHSSSHSNAIFGKRLVSSKGGVGVRSNIHTTTPITPSLNDSPPPILLVKPHHNNQNMSKHLLKPTSSLPLKVSLENYEHDKDENYDVDYIDNADDDLVGVTHLNITKEDDLWNAESQTIEQIFSNNTDYNSNDSFKTNNEKKNIKKVDQQQQQSRLPIIGPKQTTTNQENNGLFFGLC